MDEGYNSLPTSHLLGSVPAAVVEDKRPTAYGEASSANLQSFPPANGDGDEQTPTSWKGVFSISSYCRFFNVDTGDVVDRLISSVYPMNDFFKKIDRNPDLYGPVWISTTLIFMLAGLGSCGTYLMHKRTEPSVTWNFDVSYLGWAAWIYVYALAVPAAIYFLLQYSGSNANLIRLWCMWGYSLFIFMPTSLLLVIPIETFRWIIIILAGSASSWFIALNLKAYIEGSNLMILVVSASLLQFALALFIKFFFFP